MLNYFKYMWLNADYFGKDIYKKYKPFSIILFHFLFILFFCFNQLMI